MKLLLLASIILVTSGCYSGLDCANACGSRGAKRCSPYEITCMGASDDKSDGGIVTND